MIHSECSLKGQLSLELGDFCLNTGEFEFPLKGVTVLFGLSGSGKSTFLRALSGLESRVNGRLFCGEQLWLDKGFNLPIQKRDIGFVFQDAALFPHKTVQQNLDYASCRSPKRVSEAYYNEIVDRLSLRDLLTRSVNSLSGGEKQRVAITRALLMQPKLLCMDEPLSALDWRAKSEILKLIEQVIEVYKIPLIYITHAPNEVERLADRIIFMQAGRIDRIESLQSSLSRVDSPLFEQGAVSVLQGEMQSVQRGLCPIALGEQRLWLSNLSESDAKQVRVRVLAKDVSIALVDPKHLSITNHLEVIILECVNLEAHRCLVRLQLQDKQRLFAELTQHSVERLQLKPGMQVYALIKSVALAD